MVDIEKVKKVQADLKSIIERGEDISEVMTREALINTLLNALGYDVLDFNRECAIQVTTGSTIGSAYIDYFVKADNKYVLLIESKKLGKDLLRKTRNTVKGKTQESTPIEQLQSYFDNKWVDQVFTTHIGVLTDGNWYHFFTNSVGNRMDDEPYASFKLSDLKENDFKDALDRYSKSEILKFKKREALLADVRLQKFKTSSKCRAADCGRC